MSETRDARTADAPASSAKNTDDRDPAIDVLSDMKNDQGDGRSAAGSRADGTNMTAYKKLGFALGLFSIALGAAELFVFRRIARAMDADGHAGLIRGFGTREVVAGLGLLGAPASSAGVWNRVAGDTMDLAALGIAARKRPRKPAVWGALGFVAIATVLDVVVARGLDKTTGRMVPATA